nr:hypothetical protein [Clostridia bacterium]
MSEGIIIALITGGLAVISNFIVAMMNSKLTIYRIEQLEKKVEKHNNLVERVTLLEANDKAQWKYIDQFKDEMEK